MNEQAIVDTKIIKNIQDPWEKVFELHQSVLAELGFALQPGQTVLDFGCGAGDMVRTYRAAGFSAFGCDLAPKPYTGDEDLWGTGLLSRISEQPYRLPFDNDSFDFVFSHQVLEHVRDYRAAFSEIYRVLRPGAVSLHFFAPRYRIIEGHVKVPFASMIQSDWWLCGWSLIGVGRSTRDGLSGFLAARHNGQYLRTCTNYLKRKEIKRQIAPWFPEAYFCEKVYLRRMFKSQPGWGWLVRLPLVDLAFSALRRRVLFLVKPAADAPHRED